MRIVGRAWAGNYDTSWIPKFSVAWRDTLSVLAARGRAQVSVAAATTDWPKRIRDMRYDDQDDHGTAD